MWKAIQQDDAGKLEELLAGGKGKVGEVNKKGETLPMACVESEAHECLKLLMGKNVALDVVDKTGTTVVVKAVQAGDTQSLELLAARPKALLVADKDGLTPLHWAVRLSDTAVVELLLGLHEVRKELLSRFDKKGYAPIHTGIEHTSSDETLTQLLEADKEQLVLCEKQHGRTPLLMAAAYANPDAFALLLRSGADLNAIDKSSKNVLHLAAQSGELPPSLPKHEMERFLFSPDVDGNTPMHLAAASGDQSMFAELKGLGGDETKTNLAGKSALSLFQATVAEMDQEDQAAVAQMQKEAEEKERAKREAEEAKSRIGATIEAKFAEKNAAKYAKRRARAAERGEAEQEGEEEEEEEERKPVMRKNEAKQDESKPAAATARQPYRKGEPRTEAPAKQEVVVGGTRSVMWMVALVVLFLAIFVGAKVYGKK